MMKRVQILVLIGSLAGISGCDIDLGNERVQSDFHYSYDLQPGGHLDVDNQNGSIAIVGWDRSSIDVSGTKFARNNEALKEVQIKVNVTGNMASIVTELPNDSWGSFGANYTIRVPRSTLVTRAKSTNGSVSAEDMSAGGSLISTNGKIALTRDEGNFDVRTTNGSIDLDNCSGIERAETTNGHVRGMLKAGAFEARSTNGSIDLSISKPQPDESLRAVTTNGSVKVALDSFASNPIRVETSHGSITLRLPHNTDAQLDAHNSLASISSELAVTGGESDKHELRGQLGKGGPIISVATSTGSIRIEDNGR